MRDFHRGAAQADLFEKLIYNIEFGGKPRLAWLLARVDFGVCTISGHVLVDGVHSIENTCTYKGVFFVDSQIRRSTTGSFFDSFLSFSGWCGVRGSSEVTFLIARLGRRASKGL